MSIPSRWVALWQGDVRAEIENVSQGIWGPWFWTSRKQRRELSKRIGRQCASGALSDYKLEYKWKYNSIRARSAKFVFWLANILMRWSRNEASILDTLPNIVICCPYKPGLMMKTGNKPVLHAFYVPHTVLTLQILTITFWVSYHKPLFVSKEPVALKV